MYNTVTNNRIGMHYAQYWCGTDAKGDSQYSSSDGGSTNLWTMYSVVLPALKEIQTLNETATDEVAAANQNAIAGVFQIWVYHMLTDAFGNIPYSNAITEELLPTYDDAKTVYTDLLSKLDTYQSQLNPANPSFTTGDVIYNGDVTKWKKFANSLMLRIAMRMSNKDETTAKPYIEKAIQAGIIETNDDNALFPYNGNATEAFPFNNIDRDPVQFVVSATLIDYMKEVNDPRLPQFARTVGNVYKGSPYASGENNASDAQIFSLPSIKVYNPDFPGIIFTASEAQFLKAEAAARNMSAGGTAVTFYNSGIEESMTFWGVSADSTTAYSARVPFIAANWKDCIGTQKWLAFYMQGMQSWHERVRLDFNKPDGTPLFIAPVEGSLDPSVTMVPNRITYPTSENNTNKANKDAASQAIGGDTKGTKLWWQN
ncbi:SusD/RagB family nutrient-binding outer membrane lipoprotein [Niabella ginsengisoli]|uniref:SusD/RagB family nutrient-binding outer membrane lipoprotein n=1 Tax=Niabella ginsengisoli TaxID=522298 RepID=A0ABS9SGI8_9BACT|nr:SusD/RagB family nutrient-binding outer membrane lipoprotein [Niabella ginsengisoli]MCH5597445.1 SusD/RagB family nutrient-binding outer membrane lipoprotein [Niabella ginsengisoli]